MLDEYQNEVVPALKEQLATQQSQSQTNVTEEELQALKIVATGCNTNTRLSGQREYVDSLVMVFKLIERLEA
jgi:hypothetical protein